MEIREIEKKDMASALSLVAGTMADTPYRKSYCGELAKDMRYYLRRKGESAQFVALDNGKVIGFALAGKAMKRDVKNHYFINHADPLEPLSWILLKQITVDSAYRGKGIGALLLQEIEKRAKALKLKGVYTGTRGDIRHFYEKAGFSIDKVYLKKETPS